MNGEHFREEIEAHRLEIETNRFRPTLPDIDTRSRAELFSDAIGDEFQQMKFIAKADEVVHSFCATPFGMISVGWIQSGKGDFIRMAGLDSNGNDSLFIVPVGLCAFKFTILKANQPGFKEMVIKGYSEK